VVLLTAVVPARADETVADRARKQAALMYQAFLRGDFDTFVSFTHPKVVRLMGGPEKVKAELAKVLADGKAQGISVRSATVSPPQQITRSGAHAVQAIVPTELVMVAPGKEGRQTSFLLGLSPDDGRTWKFVDTARVGGEAVRKLFPECSPALKIPSRPKAQMSAP
jgi:hypothetical protein